MPFSPPLRGSSIPSWSVQPTAHAVGYGSVAPAGALIPAPPGRCGMNTPHPILSLGTTPGTTALPALMAVIRPAPGRTTHCSEVGSDSIHGIQTEQ